MARKARQALPRGFDRLEARALLSATPAPTVWAASEPVDPGSALFVRFAAGTPAARAGADLDAVGGRVVRGFPDGSELVALAPWQTRAGAVEALRVDPAVVYAEADGTFHASGVPSGPVRANDPMLTSQWGLGMIDAPYAWAVTTGTPSTIVAVLDTGLDLTSPEFAGRVWTNPQAGNDGHKGDVHGWNFVNNSGNVSDDNGHGTHVSGILGAAGDNGYGVAGVDWGARIMPLKVLDSQGNGTSDSAVAAVYFAVAHGARVINASWGGDSFSRAMLDALNYAGSKGVVFVTAAGNDGANNDAALADPAGATSYPASFRTGNELAVAAVDRSGTLAGFSNYGAATVDLAAPGVGVVSTVPGGFATFDGTSMATPFVSGTVALLAGLNPAMSAAQLVARVRATAKPFPQLKGLLVSPGVVDPVNALLNRTPLHPAGPTATGLGGSPAAPAPAPAPAASPYSAVERGLLGGGAVYSLFGGTAASYVDGLYRAVDGRPAAADELGYYAAALASGEGRADLVSKLQNSTEGGLTRVARWYIDELGATATVAALKSDPGVAAYAAVLASGSGVGAVQGLMFANAVAAFGTPGRAVDFVYRGLLRRKPDPGGLALFTAELNSGASVATVARQVLASGEGHVVTVADLYRNDLGSSAGLASLAADAGVAYWAGLLGAD